MLQVTLPAYLLIGTNCQSPTIFSSGNIVNIVYPDLRIAIVAIVAVTISLPFSDLMALVINASPPGRGNGDGQGTYTASN